MSKRLALLLGGARSGKSSYAEKLATQAGPGVLYVATAEARDEEMRARIAAHKRQRPASWRTLEAPTGVGQAILAAVQEGGIDAVLLDCLTLLVSNVILEGLADRDPDEIDEASAQARVAAELEVLFEVYQTVELSWIVVSNQVGCGLVPTYRLGRVYRDLLGWANQQTASLADQVYLMIAGLPVDVKALSAIAEDRAAHPRIRKPEPPPWPVSDFDLPR